MGLTEIERYEVKRTIEHTGSQGQLLHFKTSCRGMPLILIFDAVNWELSDIIGYLKLDPIDVHDLETEIKLCLNSQKT